MAATAGPAVALTRALLEDDLESFDVSARLLTVHEARHSAAALLASVEAQTHWTSELDDLLRFADFAGRDARIGMWPRSRLHPVALVAATFARVYVGDILEARRSGRTSLILPTALVVATQRTTIAAVALLCLNVVCFASEMNEDDVEDLLDGAAESARLHYCDAASG